MSISYKTSSPTGDLISILPSIRQIYRATGRKAIIYQALNIVGIGLPNQPQPYLNSDGESIMMGKQTFDMVRPLLLAQEYIEDFLEFKGEKVDYDIDEIRLKTFTNQPHGSLARWPFYGFPEMACDLSERSIEVKPKNKTENFSIDWGEKKYIPVGGFGEYAIINFTSRYRNHWINYFFLKQYEGRIVFAGLPKEHADFCRKWELDIPLLKMNDFYELAQAMASCKFFMGNQSAFFQIAEGLKIPRILEVCQVMPNVIPTGPGPAYDFYHQQAVELYVHKLFNQ